MNNRQLLVSLLIAPVMFASSFSVATAATVWTDWTSMSAGEPGSAAGSMGGVGITYSGEVRSDSVVADGVNQWYPTSTFIGGVVDVSPSSVKDMLRLDGSTTPATITFASPVVNPVMAIFSLGAPSTLASFTFNAAPTLIVDGPNSSFAADLPDLTINGNTVSGYGGNGIILFQGTYSSLSFSTSGYESYFGFTVGTAGPISSVPVPAAAWLLGSGLLGLVGVSRRRG